MADRLCVCNTYDVGDLLEGDPECSCYFVAAKVGGH